jgi:hypothetical protein
MTTLEKVQRFAQWWPRWLCPTPLMQRFILVPWVVLAVCVAVLAQWAQDRAPTLEIVEQLGVPTVRPGQEAYLRATVRRDLTRDCHTESSRYLLTSDGYRHMEGDSFLSDTETLRRITAGHPNEIRTTYLVPSGAAPGPAQVVTVLLQECNPLHKFWPIRSTTVLALNIEGPASAPTK